MRLAVAKRTKEVTFISSVGVVGGLDHPQPVLESEDGPALCDVHPGDGGYALGCALYFFPFVYILFPLRVLCSGFWSMCPDRHGHHVVSEAE